MTVSLSMIQTDLMGDDIMSDITNATNSSTLNARGIVLAFDVNDMSHRVPAEECLAVQIRPLATIYRLILIIELTKTCPSVPKTIREYRDHDEIGARRVPGGLPRIPKKPLLYLNQADKTGMFFKFKYCTSFPPFEIGY